MITLKLSYREMDFIRNLVKKQRLQIWRTKFLPMLKDKSSTAIAKTYDKFLKQDNEFLEEGVCAILLRKFQIQEHKIKKEFSQDKTIV